MIGGIHRFFLGGATSIPCSLATILAGLLAGLVYRLNKEKLLGIIPAMLFAVAIELMHAGLVFLMVSPFNEALEIVKDVIPAMLIANSLGVGISIIVINNVKESTRSVASE